jgi:cysteine desulfuration protein SufE
MTQPSESLEGMAAAFSALDRTARIQMLIDLAARYRPVPERIATRPYPADHRVPGCESEAYVWAEANPDGTLQFHFAVENPQGMSAKALAAILHQTLSGGSPTEAAEVSPDLVYALFGAELSMGKSLGLQGMVHMVRALARRHQAGGRG